MTKVYVLLTLVLSVIVIQNTLAAPIPFVGCWNQDSCPESYYGASPAPFENSAIAKLLPLNNEGEKLWLSLFPVLDNTSTLYKQFGCDQPTNEFSGRVVGGSGCYMWSQGPYSGLQAFHDAAKAYPGLTNSGNDINDKNELIAILSNLIQETGDSVTAVSLGYSPAQGGLCFSLEYTAKNPMTNLWGRGALQLTGAANYYLATVGISAPTMYLFNNDAGAVSVGNGNDPPVGNSYWDAAKSRTAASQPQGSGYNVVNEPSLASDKAVSAWSTSFWYWMNRPLARPDTVNYLQLDGSDKDRCCATAHNIVQNPVYALGNYAGMASYGQVGCPSCCTKPSSALDHDSLLKMRNRAGAYISVAITLGVITVDEADSTFCDLLNYCGSAKRNLKTCSGAFADNTYSCYKTQSENGNCSIKNATAEVSPLI